jgi:hypothetical protein
VLANHAPYVFTVASGFATKAGGIGTEGDGELGFVEGFVSEEICDRNLGSRDEPVVALLKLARYIGNLVVAVKEVFGELRKLAGSEQGTGIDHVRGENLGITMLAGVKIKHEVG